MFVLLFGCAYSQVSLDETGQCRHLESWTLMRQARIECKQAHTKVEHKGMSLTFAHVVSAVGGFLAGLF